MFLRDIGVSIVGNLEEKIGSIKFTSDGCQLSFEHAKQLSEVKENTSLVPFYKNDLSPC